MQHFNSIKFSITTLVVCLSAFCLSCSKLLDEQPISEISSKNYWKNNTDAATGVAAIYDAMQATYRLKYFLWGEFRADNFKLSSLTTATRDYAELVLQALSDGNAPVTKWDSFYDMINRANLAIKYIPTIANYDKNLLAEAYAIRAFAYFDAIRVWGAVPLFITPTESLEGIFKQRTDATVILDSIIIPDMLRAEALITSPTRNFRFSKVSVLCLQAEVYMWLKDYAQAKNALDKMMAVGGHSLVTSVQAWEDMFYNNLAGSSFPEGKGKIQTGTELMFSIRYELQETRDNATNQFANRSGIFGLFFAGVPSFFISPELELKWQQKFPIDSSGWVRKYPNVKPALSRKVTYLDSNGALKDSLAPVYGDWRYFLSREGGYQNFGSRAIGEARMAKYNKTNYNPNFDDTDIPVYRYAGMLLLLAEAENRLGNSTRALELVNRIRTARLLPTVMAAEFGTTTEMREDFILDERQLELLGEGKRWWDLRRTDKAIDILNPILSQTTGAVLLTKDRLLFPIYIQHLIENPLLEQTKGY